MLENRTYPISELAEILHTRDTQGIKRKLQNYGISYTENGWGSNLQITITDIENPFKVFCITELGFSAICKFERLKNLVIYFFCYDEFRELPDEKMEIFLREKDHYVCRQTIRGWMEKLEQNNLILQHSGDYIYYGIRNGERCEMSKEQYCAAWRSYFEDKEEVCLSREAFMNMIQKFGCIPRKKEVAFVNGIHAQTIDTLIDLAQKEIEKELSSGEPE